MMEIVIKISEDVYTRLFDNGIQDNEIATDDICEMARALRLGTSLPKGHGRLIDADAMQKYQIDTFGQRLLVIDTAPTIIEGSDDE